MACMIFSAIAHAIRFFYWQMFVDHRLGDLWLFSNHGRLVIVEIGEFLAAIDGGSNVSHGF